MDCPVADSGNKFFELDTIVVFCADQFSRITRSNFRLNIYWVSQATVEEKVYVEIDENSLSLSFDIKNPFCTLGVVI